MKFLLNILPAICFFLTYKLAGGNLIWATGAIVISSVICFALNYVLYRAISRFQVVLLAVLLLFALPTIWLNDTNIIKLKVSVINIALALIILALQFIFKKNIVEAVSGVKTPIPTNLWQKATIAVAGYLILCAGLNYILAFKLPDLFSSFSAQEAEDLWVAYKSYGNGILNFIFVLLISFWMTSKLSPEQKAELENLMNKLKEAQKANKKKLPQNDEKIKNNSDI